MSFESSLSRNHFSRKINASKVEDCDNDCIIRIGLKEVLILTGMMVFQPEDVQISYEKVLIFTNVYFDLWKDS